MDELNPQQKKFLTIQRLSILWKVAVLVAVAVLVLAPWGGI